MEKEQYKQQMNDYFETISTLVLNNRYLCRNPNEFNFNAEERFAKQIELLQITLDLLSIDNEIFTSCKPKRYFNAQLLKLKNYNVQELNRICDWLEENYKKNATNIDDSFSKIQKKETAAIKECERFMNVCFNDIIETSIKIKFNSKNKGHIAKLNQFLNITFKLFSILINGFIAGLNDEQMKVIDSLTTESKDLKEWIDLNIPSKTN